jgi:hypothetical protein
MHSARLDKYSTLIIQIASSEAKGVNSPTRRKADSTVMSKKRKRDPLHDFDPAIEKLAMERFLSGKQIFDYRTHRLRSFIRDEVQGRGVLLRAQEIAREHGKELVLSYLEKKLLAKAFNDIGKAA